MNLTNSNLTKEVVHFKLNVLLKKYCFNLSHILRRSKSAIILSATFSPNSEIQVNNK